MMYWWLFLLCPVAYLIGGLNFSKIITKLRHIDLSQVGSGNAGATNVGRAMGFGWFLLVTLLEVFKGAVVCLLGYLFVSLWQNNFALTADHFTVILALGLSALIGAVFPVWYRFKGGKGIATWIGLGFFLNPLSMAIDAVLFIPLLLVTHIMSISTLLGVIVWVVASLLLPVPFGSPVTAPIVTLYCVIAALLLFAHRKNIARLFNGTEKKFVLKKKQPETK